jgi:hypothetical protein
MKNDTTILPFRQSESIADPLTELAREGARRMLAEALKAEADAFVASFADKQLEDGRQRIVRHGFGPERKIQTGIGALDVQRPKVRDRMATPDPAEKIRFTSNILPKWARRAYSGVIRPLIPKVCGHPFRFYPATDSGASGHPVM